MTVTDEPSTGVVDLQLSSITELRHALQRFPGGVEAVRLFARLGLWSVEAHKQPGTRQPFPSKFSDLGPDELSDLSARVVADSGRVLELVGVLNGIEAKLKIEAKAVRAAARARARRAWSGEKAPTKAEIDDLAEEDPAVRDVDTKMSLLAVLLAAANAAKEANTLYKEGVSREITYRAAQLNARMY